VHKSTPTPFPPPHPSVPAASESLQKLWFVDTVLWLCPSQLMKYKNTSHRCPSQCRNHCDCDIVASGIVFPRPTCWDFGLKQYFSETITNFCWKQSESVIPTYDTGLQFFFFALIFFHFLFYFIFQCISLSLSWRVFSF